MKNSTLRKKKNFRKEKIEQFEEEELNVFRHNPFKLPEAHPNDFKNPSQELERLNKQLAAEKQKADNWKKEFDQAKIEVGDLERKAEKLNE